MLMVFYVRGDILFLTLALIALTGAALTLRQTLPRYAAEIWLSCSVSAPVREEVTTCVGRYTIHRGFTQCLFSLAESYPRGSCAATLQYYE